MSKKDSLEEYESQPPWWFVVGIVVGVIVAVTTAAWVCFEKG